MQILDYNQTFLQAFLHIYKLRVSIVRQPRAEMFQMFEHKCEFLAEYSTNSASRREHCHERR